MRILLIVNIVAAMFISSTSAKWSKESDAPYAINRSDTTIQVHRDGTFDQVDDLEFEVLNDHGREYLKVYNLVYRGGTETYKILSASTVNGKKITAVKTKDIEDKPIASEREGFQKRRQISFAFPDIVVGSKLRIRYQHSTRAVPLKGVFNSRYIYGATVPERGGKVEISAPFPLFLKTNDPMNVLEQSNGRKGASYIAKIKLKAPIYRALSEEYGGVPDPLLATTAEVSSVDTWNQIAKPYAERLEKGYAEPLPPEFQTIADAAALEKTNEDKINRVMGELAKLLTYLGNWRTVSGEYFPRTLKEIASKKFADCKDYSFATTAILRKLGFLAKTALVNPRPPNIFYSDLKGPPNGLLPSLDFSHAIVRTEVDGKAVWLDPTHPVAYSKDVYSNIAGQDALVSDVKSVGLERIPPNQPSTFELDSNTFISFRSGGDFDVDGELKTTARASAEILSYARLLKGDLIQPMLLRLAGTEAQPQNLDFDPFKLESKIATDLGFRFRYRSSDRTFSSVSGPIYPFKAPSVLNAFFKWTSERVTGFDLGEVGTYRTKQTFNNVAIQGAPPPSCSIKSKWVDVERKVEGRPKALQVTTTVSVKERDLPAHEMAGADFTKMRDELAKCFEKSSLMFNYADVASAPLPVPSVVAPPPVPNTLERVKKTVTDWVSKAEPPPVKVEKPAPVEDTLHFANEMISNKDTLLKDAQTLIENDENYSKYIKIRLLADEYLSTHPNDAQATYLLGFSTLELGYINGFTNYEPEAAAGAKPYVARALAHDPNHIKANILQARLLWIDKQVDQAKAQIAKVLQIAPTNVTALGLAGNLESETKNYAVAATYFEKAIAAATVANQKAHLLQNLGSAQAWSGQLPLAVESYKKSMETDPADAWIIGNTADFYGYTVKDYKEAVRLYEAALKIKNYGAAQWGLTDAYTNLGWAELQQANIPGAIKHFQGAIELRSTAANAYLGLAEAYHEMASIGLKQNDNMQLITLSDQNGRKAVEIDPRLRERYDRMILERAHFRSPASVKTQKR